LPLAGPGKKSGGEKFLSRKAIIFLTFVIFFGVISWPLALKFDLPRLYEVDISSLILFTFLATIAESYPIVMRYRKETNELTVSTAFHFAMIILFPPSLAALGCAFASVVADTFQKKAWYKTFFNAVDCSICALAAGYVLQLMGYSLESQFIKGLPILTLGAVTYYVLNSALVSTTVAFAQDSSPKDIYLTNIKMQTFAHITIFALGILTVKVFAVDKAALPLLFLPMIAIYFAYKNYVDLQVQAKDTIESLAEAIDKRDAYTRQHSDRVASYAASLAKAVGLREDHVFNIVTAARVHDIGKIGVDDATLFNRNELGPDEIKKIQEHPSLGREIVSNLHVYRKELDMIAHHHERYDGRGYPDGLKGEAIPLGARILAIADAYDAMLSDRPYRRALSKSQAIGQLKEGAGSQFDPYLVWSFIGLLSKEMEQEETKELEDVSAGNAVSLLRYRLSTGR
jgi:hypothetical protein